MAEEQDDSLAHLISQATGAPWASVIKSHPCSGGCIHEARVVQLSDQRRFFIKSKKHARQMYAQEAIGLRALAGNHAVRTPQVIARGPLNPNRDCLVLEAILPAAPSPDFWESFGRGLARLHQSCRADQCGFKYANYLGANWQPNNWTEDWVAFFAEYRLTYQLRLACSNSLATAELTSQTQRLIDRLDSLIGNSREQPSLLHGDLWSGNYLVDEAGQPVLIDPAVYFGHREAELAMPLLFGGFAPRFFEAYNEFWPLEDGWQERVGIYQLYHLLNHLNLFGKGYLNSCLEIVRRFTR
jgi:fructosamine-3-kinase